MITLADVPPLVNVVAMVKGRPKDCGPHLFHNVHIFSGASQVLMTAMIDCGSPFSMMSQDIIAWHGIPGNDTDILPAHDLNGNRIQLYQRH